MADSQVRRKGALGMKRGILSLVALCLGNWSGILHASDYVAQVLYELQTPPGLGIANGPNPNPLYPYPIRIYDGQAIAPGIDESGNSHALYWLATGGASVDLNPIGTTNALAYGLDGQQQIGEVVNDGGSQAALWSGSASTFVDLNPTGFTHSEAWGVAGGQQVGGGAGPNGYTGALLWSGSAASVVTLNPNGYSSSMALGTDGHQQVGWGVIAPEGNFTNFHAMLWSGSADSYVDLNPADYSISVALSNNAGQQVGFGQPADATNYHALLWSGTAASVVDLNPSTFSESYAYAINDGEEVGNAELPEGRWDAFVWSGTATSAVDLSTLLPSAISSTISYSCALSIDNSGDIFGIATPGPGSTYYIVEWTPTPEPKVGLFAALLGGFLILRRPKFGVKDIQWPSHFLLCHPLERRMLLDGGPGSPTPPASPGTVILIIESALLTQPGMESRIERLEQDLIGAGWNVDRPDEDVLFNPWTGQNYTPNVNGNPGFPTNVNVDYSYNSQTNSTTFNQSEASQYISALDYTKGAIIDAYTRLMNLNENPTSLFIIGHVAIPYSGVNGHWDGHTYPGTYNTEGAWPTDSYYGDIKDDPRDPVAADHVWTDTASSAAGSGLHESTENLPGDGRFDQDQLPEPLQLAVGRVDMSPGTGGQSAAALTEQYLDKDHAYRYETDYYGSQLVVPQSAILLDARSTDYDGGDNWVPLEQADGVESLVGETNESAEPWVTEVSTNPVTYAISSYMQNPNLWAVGYHDAEGGDTFSGWNPGVADYSDFFSNSLSSAPKTVFYLTYGSYMGIWDVGNEGINFVRQPLANKGWGLADIWDGPALQMGDMATGATIGSALLESQNGPINIVAYSLMGDPTLIQSIVAPPTNVTIIPDASNHAELSWSASADPSVTGYYIYYATSMNGPFQLASTNLVTGTSFDTSDSVGQYVYMVRAEKLQNTPSNGSYWNTSEGTYAVALIASNNNKNGTATFDTTTSDPTYWQWTIAIDQSSVTIPATSSICVSVLGLGTSDSLSVMLPTGASPDGSFFFDGPSSGSIAITTASGAAISPGMNLITTNYVDIAYVNTPSISVTANAITVVGPPGTNSFVLNGSSLAVAGQSFTLNSGSINIIGNSSPYSSNTLTLVGTTTPSATWQVISGFASGSDEIGLSSITLDVELPSNTAGIQLSPDTTIPTATDVSFGSSTIPDFVINYGDFYIAGWNNNPGINATFAGTEGTTTSFALDDSLFSAQSGSYSQIFQFTEWPIEYLNLVAGSVNDSLQVYPNSPVAVVTFYGDGGHNEISFDGFPSATTYNAYDISASAANGQVDVDNQTVGFFNVPVVYIEGTSSTNELNLTGTSGSDTIANFAYTAFTDALLLNKVLFEYENINDITLYTDGGSDSLTDGGMYNGVTYGVGVIPINVSVPMGPSNVLQLSSYTGISSMLLGNLTVGAGAKTIFDSGDNVILKLDSLNLGSPGAYGTLDLTDDSMVDYDDGGIQIRSYLVSGNNGGVWNGTGIISSTAASGGLSVGKTLGYAVASDLGTTPMWQSLPSGSVVVKYTYLGDTNLDGNIDATDLANMNAGQTWQNQHPQSTADWYQGDVNYDGKVNQDDWILFQLTVAYAQKNSLNYSSIAGAGYSAAEAVPLVDVINAGSLANSQSEYPTLNYYNADFNGDDVVNSSDITEFNSIGALYGVNMVVGTSGNDTFTIQPNSSTGMLNILLGNTTVESLPLNTFYNIEIVGDGGNDTLIVDTSQGNLNDDSITFDGGGGTLTLVGSDSSNASSVMVSAGQASSSDEIGITNVASLTVGTPNGAANLNQDATNSSWTDLNYGTTTAPIFMFNSSIGNIGIAAYDTWSLGITFNGTANLANNFVLASGSMTVTIGSSYSQSFSFNAIGVNLNGGNLNDSVTVDAGVPAYTLEFDGGQGDNTIVLNGNTSTTTAFYDDYGLIFDNCTIPLTYVQNVIFNAGTINDTLQVGAYPYNSSITFNGIAGGNNELILQTGSGQGDNDFNATVDGISMDGLNVAFSNVSIVDISATGTANVLTVTGTSGNDSINSFAYSSSVDALLLNNVTFEYSGISQTSLYTGGGNDTFTTGYGSYSAPTTPIGIYVPAGSSNFLQLNATSSISTIVLSGLTVSSGATATIQSGKHLDLYMLNLGSTAPYGTLNIANDLTILYQTGTSADQQVEAWAYANNGTGLTSWAGGAGVYDSGSEIVIYED